MLDTSTIKEDEDQTLDLNSFMKHPIQWQKDDTDFKSTDFDLTEQQRNLLALNAFLESPRSIGIDSLKESLSNVVRYMLELQGLDTGQDAQIFSDDEHDSIGLGNRKKSSKAKRKQAEMDADLMRQLEEQLTQSFGKAYDHIENKLDNVEANIDNNIEQLNAEIAALEDDGGCSEKLETKRAKRKRLRAFRKQVKNYRKEISLAEETMDMAKLIEIEQNLHIDHEAFNSRGIFPPVQRATNISDFLPRGQFKIPGFPDGDISFGVKAAVEDLFKGVDELADMIKFEAKNNSEPSAPSPDADGD